MSISLLSQQLYMKPILLLITLIISYLIAIYTSATSIITMPPITFPTILNISVIMSINSDRARRRSSSTFRSAPNIHIHEV